MEHEQQKSETNVHSGGPQEQVFIAKNTGNPFGMYAIPAAIVFAGLLVAGAIMYSGGSSENNGTAAEKIIGQVSASERLAEGLRPVTSKDHIRGSISAPVKIIEFSDLECPFCKRFHSSLQLLMDDYGKRGEVAWVYRHFPLDSLHSKARKEAQATECANELGGNDAFWKYIDRFFEVTPSNNNTDLSTLPDIAEYIGLNRGAFTECVGGSADGGKYAAHIEADVSEAIRLGGTGTPYSVIVAPNGKTFPLLGAQSYTAVKALIELALKETR